MPSASVHPCSGHCREFGCFLEYSRSVIIRTASSIDKMYDGSSVVAKIMPSCNRHTLHMLHRVKAIAYSPHMLLRFELPYNIWCGGCGSHVGMGVRYNAEKTTVGKYYSTPIFKFRMKCHLCDNHFEIQTDPKVLMFTSRNGGLANYASIIIGNPFCMSIM